MQRNTSDSEVFKNVLISLLRIACYCMPDQTSFAPYLLFCIFGILKLFHSFVYYYDLALTSVEPKIGSDRGGTR